MLSNPLKEKLERGEAAFACFVNIPSPMVV